MLGEPTTNDAGITTRSLSYTCDECNNKIGADGCGCIYQCDDCGEPTNGNRVGDLCLCSVCVRVYRRREENPNVVVDRKTLRTLLGCARGVAKERIVSEDLYDAIHTAQTCLNIQR